MTKKIIGLYQLITGIFGGVIVITSLFSHGYQPELLPQTVAGVILFSLLAWAGYGLLNNLKNALKYSRILQALQIIAFSLSGTIYKFTAAAFVWFGINNSKFNYGIGDQFTHFEIANTKSTDTSITIYVIPIIILYALIRLKK